MCRRRSDVVIAAALCIIFFSFTKCKVDETHKLNNNYASYYHHTQGIRKKETYDAFLCEQRIELDNNAFLILAAHADESLKHGNPKNRKELLENIIIDMINDPETLYCYDAAFVEDFMRGNLSAEELKASLAIAGLRDYKKGQAADVLSDKKLTAAALFEFNEYRKQQDYFAAQAKAIRKTFIKNPLQMDHDFCANNRLLLKNAILTQPGVPYRVINKKEYLLLKDRGYPLLDYLLRDGTNRIFNVLPNCAQGATQLVRGYMLYTKASQLAKDKNDLFFQLDSINQLQAGDIVLIVWDYAADARTNSGHAGVIVDVNFDKRGHMNDAVLIEFFPGNASPRLINMNSSLYGDWKSILTGSGDGGADVFIVRLKKPAAQEHEQGGENTEYKPEQLIALLRMCFTKRDSYIIF
ncbi:MAG: hypothetical protein JW822_13610 [Spirochaetales bacterium]|nr:hypothetical protein [Spirochaetales bacterium]